MDKQERLLPIPLPRHEYVTLDKLPPVDILNCQKPSPDFVASVAALQLHPVGLIEHASGMQVAYGNRRIYAAHLAGLEGLWAYVYQPGDINPAQLAVEENHQRKPNPFSDYDAIMPMLATRPVGEVAKALHLPVGVVQAAVKLQGLDAKLMQLARAGKIKTGVALNLAGKPRCVQEKVLENAGDRQVTMKMVRAATTAVVQATMPMLPISNLPGGPGLVFGRAVETAKGVKLLFWEDGNQREFVVPAGRLFELVRG